MGVGEIDLPDDAKASPISCSICLEHVTDNGDRSWAKLQCGHRFHLDCIGSAFNIKGVMQCPNCRKIEKGQWLYASSSRSFPDLSFDDWVHDEDLYDLSYSEMSFGVQWCPFSGLTQLPSSFDEGENSIDAYHDFVGQHVTFDLSTTSPASHPCPYIAYTGPVHHSSSSSGDIVRGSSSFNNHWNGPSGPSEMAASYVFPAMELHYTWENNPFPFSSSSSHGGGVADQPPVPSMTQRQARPNSDMSRLGNFMRHFPTGRSSAARTGSSVTSSTIPPHPGSVARTRDRLQALQAYFQPSNSPPVRTPVISGSRRSNTHRGYSQGRHAATPSDQTGGFYYTSTSSGGRNALETESHSLSNHFYSWERENQNFFSFSQADRDPIWVPLQRPRHSR